MRAEIRCTSGHLVELAGGGLLREADSLLGQLGLSVVDSLCHVFPNSGFTYIAILKESHFAMHSWPEHELVLVDLFICSQATEDMMTGSVIEIAEWLAGSVVSSEILDR